MNLTTFVRRTLAGEEGMLLSVKNDVVGHKLYFGLGQKKTADFDAGPFPLFSVADWKGKRACHYHWPEFYEAEWDEDTIPQLEAVSGLEIEDLAAHAAETPASFVRKIQALQHLQRNGEFWVANFTQNLGGDLPSVGEPRALVLKTFYEFLKLGRNHCGGVVITNEQLFCSLSPETFLVQSSDLIKAFPIKGTGTKQELEQSGKEIAELRMVTDLVRNDLGQICESVWMERERYLTQEQGFYHARAEVQGKLSSTKLLWQDYQKLLPAGSISGAPKHRVLQILSEYESFDRAFYTGTFGLKHSADRSIFNILIRTLFVDESSRKWSFPVGAGVTIESDPLEEWRETLQKAGILASLLDHN